MNINRGNLYLFKDAVRNSQTKRASQFFKYDWFQYLLKNSVENVICFIIEHGQLELLSNEISELFTDAHLLFAIEKNQIDIVRWFLKFIKPTSQMMWTGLHNADVKCLALLISAGGKMSRLPATGSNQYLLMQAFLKAVKRQIQFFNEPLVKIITNYLFEPKDLVHVVGE